MEQGPTLPDSLTVDGKRKRIDTSFQKWLGFWRVMSSPELTSIEKQNIALLNLFGVFPQDVEGAMLEALWFFGCGREPDGEVPPERLLDWDQDWLTIWADFKIYAGIDLDSSHLHWWRFMALFESLPKDSEIKRRISVRGMNLGEISDPKTREEYRRWKEQVSLDPIDDSVEGWY